jgi:signal transduction histidine kinase
MQRDLALGLALLAVLGIAGGLLLARYILGRIDAMAKASQAIMAGDLSGRIPRLGSGDELDRLADHLNAMLERIERLMVGLREVSDNIAHDLKTPLNRLRNRAEAALADQRGSSAWREGLETTIEEADELIKIFNALLLIARLEAGALDESLEVVDLDEVVRDVADLYEPFAEEGGFQVRVETRKPALVKANRQLIGQAVANLIDNALKYATPASQCAGDRSVTVRVANANGMAEIAVADHGPGIPEADRQRALGRFVRLDASRTRPGTGLGLSLVAAVAQMHRGTLRLEDNEPGLRIVLALPVLAPPVQTVEHVVLPA